MNTYTLGNMHIVSHGKLPVLHLTETQGIVIAYTEVTEVFIDGNLHKREQHNFWHDWQSQRLHHVDTVDLPIS